MLRVLIVVDYYGWICARMASNILQFSQSSKISCSIVSLSTLHRTFFDHKHLYSQFDIVHFLAQYFTTEYIKLFRTLGVTTISTLHHSTDWEKEEQCLSADYVVTVSQQWTEWLKRRVPSINSRLFEYSNSCNSSLFKPVSTATKTKLRRQYGIREDSIVVGFFANATSNNALEDRKGTVMFVDALRLLANNHPATVIISGIGWNSIINQLSLVGIDVIYLNYAKSQEQMVKRYNLLDFYWITSQVEGGPVTLLEALSCGIPCFSTPVGLALNINKSPNIITIINHGDSALLASTTFELYMNTSAYVIRSNQGRNLICSAYETASVVPSILSFYLDISPSLKTSSATIQLDGWIFEALEYKGWSLHLLSKKHYFESFYFFCMWLKSSIVLCFSKT